MHGFLREAMVAALLTLALAGAALFLHYADLLTPGH